MAKNTHIKHDLPIQQTEGDKNLFFLQMIEKLQANNAQLQHEISVWQAAHQASVDKNLGSLNMIEKLQANNAQLRHELSVWQAAFARWQGQQSVRTRFFSLLKHMFTLLRERKFMLKNKCKRCLQLVFLRGTDAAYTSFESTYPYFLATSSPMLDHSWESRMLGKPSFLLLSHLADIDDDLLHKAKTLQNGGWAGIIVAQSHTDEDLLEHIDGVAVHRIARNRILPDCRLIRAYHLRARALSCFPFFRCTNKINKCLRDWHNYRLYGSRKGTPLPFNLALTNAGERYRASVIIGHELPALQAAVALGQKWNAPVVYTVSSRYADQPGYAPKQKKFMAEVEKGSLPFCSEICADTQALADVLLHRADAAPSPRVLGSAEAAPGSDADLQQRKSEKFLQILNAVAATGIPQSQTDIKTA